MNLLRFGRFDQDLPDQPRKAPPFPVLFRPRVCHVHKFDIRIDRDVSRDGFTLRFVFVNVNNSDAMVSEEVIVSSVPQKETSLEKSQTVVAKQILAETDAGIAAELNEAVEEPEVVENQRSNTLYYVEDKGYEFYLDSEYQDYLWKKI